MSFYSSVLACLWVNPCKKKKPAKKMSPAGRWFSKEGRKSCRYEGESSCLASLSSLWPARSMETVTSIISSIRSSWCSGASERLQHLSRGARGRQISLTGWVRLHTHTAKRLYFPSQSPVHRSASRSVSIILLLWLRGGKGKPNCNAMPRGQNNEQLLCVCC